MIQLKYVKFVRSNEVNDIFSHINYKGKKEYLYFPRSMAMTIKDVEDYLAE